MSAALNGSIVIAGLAGSGIMFWSGFSDLQKPRHTYMAARPLVVDIDAQTVTQNPAVSSPLGHVVAGWEASISNPKTGQVYCSGRVSIGSASYGVGESPKPYSFSDWTGDVCPADLRPPLEFYARWQHRQLGQLLGSDVRLVLE